MSGISDLSIGAKAAIGLTISGFAAGDILRFASYNFGATETVSFVENAAKTSGTLTVTDGTLKAVVTLFGQYVAAGFHLASDGSVGTVVSYNPVAGTAALAGLAVRH